MMSEPKNRSRSSEAWRIAQPAVELAAALIRRAHWPLALLFVLYLFSGVTAVRTDEVAITLRFGRIVGDSPAEQIQSAGLLWALPRPIDQVLRVPTGRVHEVEIADLWRVSQYGEEWERPSVSIDPEKEGYCLTGDRNIVQLSLLARYRVADPIAYALLQHDPHALLRDVVQTETVRATGRESIDTVLSEGRKVLGSTVRAESQERLDEVASGLEIISVEIAEFAPPKPVNPAFVEVNTAFIESRQIYIEAERYRETEIPKAEAERDLMLSEARIYAANVIAEARGSSEAFDAILTEFKRSPRVVAERLFIEGVETAFAGAGQRKLVQPPVGDEYHDFRITVSTR